MFRLSVSNISFLSSVFLIFLFLLYITQPPPPPLLRYRRQLGPFSGYKDCVPASQVVFLHHTQDMYTRVVENILGRLAVTRQLSYHMSQGGQCTGIFVGTRPVITEDLCSFKSVRDNIGDDSFIVTLLDESDSDTVRQTSNRTELEEIDKIIDLGIITKHFKESLIVMKHLLCLDFRDITYIDTDTGKESVEVEKTGTYKHFDRKLQKIIEELGQDEVDRQMNILEHANRNLREICNQTRSERYAAVANREQLDSCNLMKKNATDFIKMLW